MLGANGKETDDYTHSEDYRHKCEVRWLIGERVRRGQDGIAWLRNFLALKEVQPRRQRLEKDIREQWSKGHRGEKEMWHLTLS